MTRGITAWICDVQRGVGQFEHDLDLEILRASPPVLERLTSTSGTSTKTAGFAVATASASFPCAAAEHEIGRQRRHRRARPARAAAMMISLSGELALGAGRWLAVGLVGLGFCSSRPPFSVSMPSPCLRPSARSASGHRQSHRRRERARALGGNVRFGMVNGSFQPVAYRRKVLPGGRLRRTEFARLRPTPILY